VSTNRVHPIEHPISSQAICIGQSIPLAKGGRVEVFSAPEGGYLRIEQKGVVEWWILPRNTGGL
jgi:hypothetical protein